MTSLDNHLYASCSNEQVRRVNIEDFQELSPFDTGHQNIMSQISSTYEGQQIVTGSLDGSIRLFDVAPLPNLTDCAQDLNQIRALQSKPSFV